MANIAVIHYGGVKVKGEYKTFIFYEGLVEALRKNGNDVMEIITNDFLVQPWGGTNELKSKINRAKLVNDVVSFKPDLVISFNNSSIDGLENIVSCPIAVWSADHFYHFNDLEKLKSNKDRFIFFCAQSGDMADCQKIIGANPEKCFRVKPATSVQSDLNHKKINNIIFVGSPFGNYEEKEKLHKYKKEFVELGKKIIKKEGGASELTRAYKKIQDVHQTILDFGSVANRTCVLSHVAPLGLSIHGGDGWLDVGLDSSLDIFDAYNPTQIYSVAQSQDAYNGSKIGININHSQAKTGFSWRVMDILASSAVLVSNSSADLLEELGDISKEVVYNTPQEAYELCKKLLQDEDLRMRIVRRSNEIVSKFHTWEIRVSEIEKILQIKLTNEQVLKGKYILLDARDYLSWFSKKIIDAHNKEGNRIFVKVYDFLVKFVYSVLPYGIVKLMLLNNTEKRFLLGANFFFRVLNKDDLEQNLIMRIIRFILPYGLVKAVRMLKKTKRI